MMLPELQENRRSKAQVMADREAMAEFMRKKNAMAGARKADAAELKNLKAKMIKGQPHSLAYMTEQEMEAMNELRREPGLRGRLARRGAGKKFDFVDGVPSFAPFENATTNERAEEKERERRSQEAFNESVRAQQEGSNYQSDDPFYQSTFGNRGSGDGGGGPQPQQKTPEQIEAERREARKKEWDAKNKADDEKFRREETERQRSRFTQGQMKDAEGRTMSDRGEFVDSEGRKQGEEGFDFETAERQGGYDASTGKMDTEGSFEGYRQDYKGMRDQADFSGYRDDMGTYQDAADTLRGQAATKFGGYESQISKMPDYGSQVAGMAGQMRGAGNRMEGMGSRAQSQLQALNPQISGQTRMGQRGIDAASRQVGAASRQVGGAMGDLGRASQAVGGAAMRGEGRGMGAANQLGNLAGQATDTQGLMKDRGLFAGQLETARKTAEQGNLANIRRSMAASGASPQEIARAEAEARKGGAQAGREDALRASQMAMQSGQSQLAQAGQLYGQQGAMGMQAAGMGMQGAQSQASMAGQRAAMAGQQAGMAGQQAGMAQNRANLGLAGLGQQAGNIQAGAGMAMQGAQGNLGAMGAATGALGQAQNLGLGKIGAQAGMYGQGLQAQQGLMGMGANLAGQQQSSLQSELATKGAFTDQMAGMTEAQLQDVVAQQNQAFEKEMAEKGFGLQRQAAAASRPRSPSAMDQFMGLAQTVAPFAMMAYSDKDLKKNIRSAKDKDLLEPGQIDGFLDSLFAKQYNYKNGKYGEGKQVGIMAQDLEKTQLGKQMVENTPEGKRVNFGKGLGLVMASQARLNERLNSLGA